MANKLCFKDYLICVDNKTNSKTKKKLNKKSHKKRFYGGVSAENNNGAGGDSVGISESVLVELLNGVLPGTYTSNVLSTTPNETEEEQEQKGNKIDVARQLFQTLINQPNMSRKDIIQRFIDDVGVTHSTAVSYYERLAKEAGITNAADKEDIGADSGMSSMNNIHSSGAVDNLPADTSLELNDEIENSDNPARIGVIRTVDKAHLIYKRKSEDGSFEELWVYNIGSRVNDELDIRRDILSGTDIPPKKTKSPDGSQAYTLTTLGNAQYLHITGLTN